MSGAIVRLLTCGSVDDGKSTLIGRLLVETDSVPHDTIGAAKKVRRSDQLLPPVRLILVCLLMDLKQSVSRESQSMSPIAL